MKFWTNKQVKKLKKIFVVIIIVSILTSCYNFIPKEGDLIFQDLDCGSLCEAIEKVEKGYQNTNISHMGVIVKYDNKFYVAEAYGQVKKTPLKEFLYRTTDNNGTPKVIVGRIKKQYFKQYANNFKKILDTLYGKPYDEEFEINNGKYYCCELVYEIFKNKKGENLFKLKQMSFTNMETTKIDSVWIEYFHKLKKNIPIGKPGCNPANYSKSNKIKIKFPYYKPFKK